MFCDQNMIEIITMIRWVSDWSTISARYQIPLLNLTFTKSSLPTPKKGYRFLSLLIITYTFHKQSSNIIASFFFCNRKEKLAGRTNYSYLVDTCIADTHRHLMTNSVFARNYGNRCNDSQWLHRIVDCSPKPLVLQWSNIYPIAFHYNRCFV